MRVRTTTPTTPRARRILPALLLPLVLVGVPAARASGPEVATGPATDVANSSARLTGGLDPHGARVSYTFRFGTSAAFYGQWTPLQEAQWTGSQPVDARISGLAADTTIHYALAATDLGGESVVGADQSFTTLPLAPLATDPTQLTTTSATLNGETIGGGSGLLTWWFEYGDSTDYGQATARMPAGNGARAVSAAIGGLAPGTVYHYRLVVSNGGAAQPASTDRTFTTPRPEALPPAPPRASTLPARNVTDASALLEGSVDAAGQTGTYQFEYGVTAAYGARTAAQPLGAGAQGVSAPVDGLAPFRTYHYRLTVSTPLGTVNGPDAAFTTRGDILAPNVAIDRPACNRRPRGRSCAGWRASPAAWRSLTGSADDDVTGYASGLDDVRVRVVRRSARTCRALTASRFFVPRSCAAAARTWIVAWRTQRRWLLNLPVLKPGTYQVTVRAFDHAGNTNDAVLTLHIRGSWR